MKSLHFWQRLSLQITVPIVVIALIILGSLSYYLIKAQQEEAYQRAELELRSMVVVAQGSMNRIFAINRFDALAELLSEIHVHPQVRHAAVLDSDGKFMAFYNADIVDPSIQSFIQDVPQKALQSAGRSGVTQITYHPDHKHFVAIVPVLTGPDLGVELKRNLLLISYAHDNTWYKFSSIALNELVIFLTVLFALGVLLWLGLQIVIVRPVAQLVSKLDRFAKREKIEPLPGRRYNELNLLGEALINAAQAREQYEQRLNKLSAAVEQSSDSIVITDLDARIEYVNQAFTDITGFSANEVLGRNPKVLASGNTPQSTYEAMWSALTQGKIWQGELYNRRKDGSEYREWATISPLRDDDGNITHYLASKQNITEKRAAEAQLNYLAYYDVLTGLPNRTKCLELLSEFMQQRTPRKFGAVVLFDLDGLQRINDVRGFEFGDKVLLAVSERLASIVKHQTDAVLGNLGGDLFGLLLPAHSEREHMLAHSKVMVQEVLDEISRELVISDESLTITASAGMVLYPEYADTPEAIIRHAETAIHNAKESGGNQLAVYNPAYSYQLEQRFEIERELREAMMLNQLELYVQPQQHANGEIVGVEVLCRWHHPERGMVPPGVFIEIAEKSDLIVELGDWILSEAITLLNKLPAHMTLAVNISPRQFRKYDFVFKIERLLLRSGVEPHRLILEVTENLFVEDFEDIALKMKTLKQSGVQFSIDDFGTGYSSLGYLNQLPLDELKIDKSFVDDIGDHHKEKLVEMVISMGKHLDLRVVAEGVETKSQVQYLQEQSADIVCQGYYFAKPLPAVAFIEGSK